MNQAELDRLKTVVAKGEQIVAKKKAIEHILECLDQHSAQFDAVFCDGSRLSMPEDEGVQDDVIKALYRLHASIVQELAELK